MSLNHCNVDHVNQKYVVGTLSVLRNSLSIISRETGINKRNNMGALSRGTEIEDLIQEMNSSMGISNNNTAVVTSGAAKRSIRGERALREESVGSTCSHSFGSFGGDRECKIVKKWKRFRRSQEKR